jgi:CheY-like chemotaxis protein
VGKNERDEPYFIIWNNGAGAVGQFDIESYNVVLQDAKKAELKHPYHVYARYELFQSKNVRVAAPTCGIGIEVPCHLHDGNDDEATRNEAVDAGCIAYLRKPFAQQVLLNAIGKAVA